MNTIVLFAAAISWVTMIVIGGSVAIAPTISAQENLTSSQPLNLTRNASVEEKTYILVFGQRTVGNIDNSTKIVSSIVGNNSVKIEEEFLEEISLEPSQELEEQINKIVNDGINGSPCSGVQLTTQQGENISVDCISSGNRVIWYIYPIS